MAARRLGAASSPSEALSQRLSESALRRRRPILGVSSGACLATSALPAGCSAEALLPDWHACLARSELLPFSDVCWNSAAFARFALTELDLHMAHYCSATMHDINTQRRHLKHSVNSAVILSTHDFSLPGRLDPSCGCGTSVYRDSSRIPQQKGLLLRQGCR